MTSLVGKYTTLLKIVVIMRNSDICALRYYTPNAFVKLTFRALRQLIYLYQLH